MAIPLPALNSSFGHGNYDHAAPEITFYYDIVCPYAYLAAMQLPALAEGLGAQIDWRPILLGGVLGTIGSNPNAAPAPRLHMTRLDIARWAEHLGIELHTPAEHPRRTVEAMRLLCWTPPVARKSLSLALFRAYWVEGRDISSVPVLIEIAQSVGLNGESARAGLTSPAAKGELRRRTDAAVEAGVFGVPTFVVESQSGPRLFFGQDRLHFVAAAVRAHPLATDPPKTPFRKPRAEALDAAVRAVEPVANQSQRVTFFYDFSSPFSYLASTQIEDVAARHGAVIDWRPMLLGGLFRSIGTPTIPIQSYSESKRRHSRDDLVRWAHYYDQPFHWPSRFPMVTVTALRLALLAGEGVGPLSHALFRAYWVDDGDLNDPAVLQRTLTQVGLDPGLLDRVAEVEIKDRLRENTESAIAAGVFGAPSFLVHAHGQDPSQGPQLFFGQDRLLFVEKALAQGKALAVQ